MKGSLEEEVVAFRLGLEVWEREEVGPALRRAADRPYYAFPGESSSQSPNHKREQRESKSLCCHTSWFFSTIPHVSLVQVRQDQGRTEPKHRVTH